MTSLASSVSRPATASWPIAALPKPDPRYHTGSMSPVRCLLLLLALWLLPLHSAHADLVGIVQRGAPCQPGSLLTLTHVGAGLVLPFWRSSDSPIPLRTGYAFEVGTALGCAVNGITRPGPVFFPELGYSLTFAPVDGAPDLLTHLAKIGVGVGYGFAWATVSYGARLLVGAQGPEVAVGVRHGVTGRFLYNILSVEFTHQLLAVAGSMEQDVRATASVNLFLFLLAVGAMR